MLSSIVKNSIDPSRIAQQFEIIAVKIPSGLRKAIGRCGSLVYQKRKELLLETIYNRPPTNRPFTNHLKDSEWFQMRGNAVVMGNTASYQIYRGEIMKGKSKRWGHELESKFASRAVSETEKEREEIITAAFKDAHDFVFVAY